MMLHFDTINEALAELAYQLTSGHEYRTLRSRLGEEIREIGPVQIEIRQPRKREVLVPGRRANVAAQIVETAWVLSGRNDIEAILPYLPRAKDFSDDGETWSGAYGPRLRAWGLHGPDALTRATPTVVDQLKYVINELKRDPLSRRAVIQIFDPVVDNNPDAKDIPCNNWLSFRSDGEQLTLHVGVRSNDLIWGFSGINAFEWSTLLAVVAECTGLEVGSLVFSTTSLHLYDRHYEKADQLAKYRCRTYGDSSQPWANTTIQHETTCEITSLGVLDASLSRFWDLEDRIRNNTWSVDDFRSLVGLPSLIVGWLVALLDYWGVQIAPGVDTREFGFYMDSSLRAAVEASPRPQPQPDPVPASVQDFLDEVNGLHAKKHAAYGDSWKRRGEQVGILANIARKVDRLGKTDDLETSADTAIDLMVYLAKYAQWLEGKDDGPEGVAVRLHESYLDTRKLEFADSNYVTREDLYIVLPQFLDIIIRKEWSDRRQKRDYVNNMLRNAFRLALLEWDSSKEEK